MDLAKKQRKWQHTQVRSAILQWSRMRLCMLCLDLVVSNLALSKPPNNQVAQAYQGASLLYLP